MVWCITGCLAILLLPSRLFTETGFQLWWQANTPYVVLVMLFAAANLLSPLLMQCWDTLEQRLGLSLSAARFRRLVPYLDANENAVLREFILQRKTALLLPIDDPAVNNLLHTGFLQASDPVVILGAHKEQRLSVSLAARPYLTRKVLNLPTRKLTEHELEWLRSSRSKFAANRGSMVL